ncbi:MAG TPA: RagB/SusD family nutrient uptake outer membrane protein [Gemmatimonadaceae bacterium]|nr:RagB/SusD family nutrient uptake outer membrane protein [Gemmatimonadaceae bacterium]
MKLSQRNTTARRSRQGILLFSAALLLGALAACDSLLDVPVPSRIPAGPLETPANAILLANGAIGDFDCALGSFIIVGGELTDELEDATETAARWVYDKRVVPTDQELYSTADCDDEGTYIPTNRARESADNVLRILQNATDQQMPGGVSRDSLIATLAAYAGYARIQLGEMFCSSVISTLNPDGSITYGTELTPTQMLQSADSSFTLAITTAQSSNNNQDALEMAYIGRARAELDQGLWDAAKADAQQVAGDVNYEHVSTASSTTVRRENRVWAENNSTAISSSVGPRYQNMTYNGVPDHRVPTVDFHQLSESGLEEWEQLKYSDVGTSIPIAKWSEAELIIAEADVRDGDPNSAITIINTLHERAGLPDYNGATDQASVLNQVIEERSRELFLEGQRLYDVIRNNMSLQPPPGAPYRNGGQYGPDGSQLCLKLPDIERANNPNLSH